MASYKYARSKLRNISLIAVFGVVLFSVVPTFLDSTTTNIRLAIAQPEDPFPVTGNETLTPAQSAAREQLLQQEGFSVSAIARNQSAPLNILYGPDNTLWITERVGKDIVRIDPTNGTKLSTMPMPNANQSKGQDGVLGMAFDPDFNNTHHIYVAYTYEKDSAEGMPELKTKITRFTYDEATNNISEPLDLINGLSGSGDHNSGRMTFGPDDKLYYTIGDQGKNQLALACLNNQAQHLPTADQVAAKNWTTYEGKVLPPESRWYHS